MLFKRIKRRTTTHSRRINMNYVDTFQDFYENINSIYLHLRKEIMYKYGIDMHNEMFIGIGIL